MPTNVSLDYAWSESKAERVDLRQYGLPGLFICPPRLGTAEGTGRKKLSGRNAGALIERGAKKSRKLGVPVTLTLRTNQPGRPATRVLGVASVPGSKPRVDDAKTAMKPKQAIRVAERPKDMPRATSSSPRRSSLAAEEPSVTEKLATFEARIAKIETLELRHVARMEALELRHVADMETLEASAAELLRKHLRVQNGHPATNPNLKSAVLRPSNENQGV